jgi:hypothetical protein
MDQPTAFQQSIEPQDKFTPQKTIYDVSYGELITRNFLAGVSRAIGGILLYAIFLAIATVIFLTYAWPQFEPFVDEYRQAVQMLNKQDQQFMRDLDKTLQGN